MTTSIVNITQVLRQTALDALAAGDYASAEAALDSLIEAASESRERAFLFNKRGVARVGLAQVERAREDFESALRLDARHAPAQSNLGNLLLEEGRIEDAIAAYHSAIDADPEYAIAYSNLSAAYRRAGRLADAVRVLRQSHRIAARKGAKTARQTQRS